jgi:hypothetical protein
MARYSILGVDNPQGLFEPAGQIFSPVESQFMKALKKIFNKERRRYPRYTIYTEVEFYIWDTVSHKPRSERVRGCLTAVSIKGGCLQTNEILIGGHHLLLHNEPSGKAVLMIEVPSSSGGPAWKVQADVISYNKRAERRRYQFDVHLQFVNLSSMDMKNLELWIRSISPPASVDEREPS